MATTTHPKKKKKKTGKFPNFLLDIFTTGDVFLKCICCYFFFSEIGMVMINNGNWTEWSPIRSVIIQVINEIGRPRSNHTKSTQLNPLNA